MKPTAYLSNALGLSPSSDERSAYNFDPIGRYFHNVSQQEEHFQTIDAQTAVDLDLDAVFERIDRTTSKVGQQALYARLRTLRGEQEVEEFGRCADHFAQDELLSARCREQLARLAGDDAYDLQNLIFDTPARVRHIVPAYLLTVAAAATLLLSPFYPWMLLLFAGIFAANLYIHYSNKFNISLYTVAVKQLSLALKTARHLALDNVPGTDQAAEHMRNVARVEHRSRVVGTQGDGGNEFAAIGWLGFELVKIAFNIEVILFHRFIGSITARREAIHALWRYVGETDAAIAVARLAGEVSMCRPHFVDGKYLEARQVVHPLLEHCVANTLTLDGTGLLLTGSNMSGKTTFIRTLTLNALLAETIDRCFAEAFSAPYMKIFSSIRIADDITEGTSYYLQEVLTIKRLLDAAQTPVPCLFVLDELFKGTNTTERIAAGKAVLAHLNRGPHIVLVSTHDIELAELLYKDGYELHHFREEVVDAKLVFDYRLHTGPLTTRNAIRILELYDYPPELIAEAYRVQEQLVEERK